MRRSIVQSLPLQFMVCAWFFLYAAADILHRQ
jgi:hypothetical protein